MNGLVVFPTFFNLWMQICDIVQEAVIKTIPKKKKGTVALAVDSH